MGFEGSRRKGRGGVFDDDGLTPFHVYIHSHNPPPPPQDCVWTNRASRRLEEYGEVYVEMLHQAIAGESLGEICNKAGAF